jgi:hypothetical protein
VGSEVPGSNLGRSADCSEVLGGSSKSLFAGLRSTPIDGIREVSKTVSSNQTTAFFLWSGCEKVKTGTVSPVHAVKACKLNGSMVPLILLPQDRGEWPVSRLDRCGKNSRYQLSRGMGGPQNQAARFWRREKKIPFDGSHPDV